MSVDTKSLKIGDLSLNKGIIRKNISMFAWDGVQQCEPEICPVTHMCKYSKEGKCSVQLNYLRALYKAILGNYSYLDEMMLFKIGMQIIPLYVQLVKMQMLELSLDRPIYETDKGAVLPHPIYKEIRETLKAIHVMWKDLDLSFSFNKKPSMGKEKDGGDIEHGDPNYYKKISSEDVGDQKGVVR